MKKYLFISAGFLLYFQLSAQSGKELLYSSTEFVWCGIDYSQVKCIGPDGFNEPDEIKNKYFGAWNDLVLDEADKYDFKEAYNKTSQINDLNIIERRNDLPEVDELVIRDDYEFQEGDLEQIISDYDLEFADEGLGLAYVVESLNKTEKAANIYVVFFDIATKEILWAKKYTEDAAGFGFRNYWARPIYETIKYSGKSFRRDQKAYMKTQK